RPRGKAISQLTHANICTLFDVGEQQGTAYLVMEYLEGETLEQRLTKGALPLDEALKIAIQIADALSAAHRRGIVRRDLKRGNVMVMKPGGGKAPGLWVSEGGTTPAAAGPGITGRVNAPAKGKRALRRVPLHLDPRDNLLMISSSRVPVMSDGK